MSTALMTEDRPQVEYTDYGNVVAGVLTTRGIRNPTAIARRILAFGGYPRKLSRQTVVNYLSGAHFVPQVFHEYVVAVAESEKPLTPAEVNELEYHYSWSQQAESANAGGVTAENEGLAREFVDKALERRNQHRRGSGQT